MYTVPKQAKCFALRHQTAVRSGEFPYPLLKLPIWTILLGVFLACAAGTKPAAGQAEGGVSPNAVPGTFLAIDAGASSHAAESPSGGAGSSSADLITIQPATPPPAKPFGAGPRVAFGASIGTQGIGLESAVSLGEHLSVRGGADLFHYGTILSQEGISYNAKLSMSSSQVSLDWFPFKGKLHISPGVMVYNGTRVNANLTVPTGQSFTLNDTDYYSNPNDPLIGSAKVTFPAAGPRLTFGFGSMVPRRARKHWSIPNEFGFAYFGTGKAVLHFSGSACSTPNDPATCEVVTSDPTFQSNLDAEQSKIQKNLAYVRFFPIAKVGISYSF